MLNNLVQTGYHTTNASYKITEEAGPNSVNNSSRGEAVWLEDPQGFVPVAAASP